MSSTADTTGSTSGDHPGATIKFFGLSLLALTLLAGASAHATGWLPKVVRFVPADVTSWLQMVIRSPPAFGLISGAVLGWVALASAVSMRRSRIAISALLIAIAFVGMTLEAYRLRVVELRALYNGPLPMLHPEMTKPLKQEREKVLAAKSRFDRYLAHRVSSNRLFGEGGWGKPWPALFWAVEIVLASFTGGWAFSIVVRRPLPADPVSSTDNDASEK